MKTRFYWVALLASAAMIAQANAGGRYGGGGGLGGGFASAHSAPARGGGGSFHSAPMRGFNGGRTIYSAQRFPGAMRSPSSMAFRQTYISSNRSAAINARSFRSDSRAIANQRHAANTAGRIRQSGNLPTNWRNHVVAQHSANWHRDWDRRHDHIWHGHHCRFINGSWVIFDFGFYPWGPFWDPYPYYYAYDYPYAQPYAYDQAYYDDSDVYSGEYYGPDNDELIDQGADSLVSGAQKELTQQGYYQGAIDGRLGPETRSAIMRYQADHGQRVTGALTNDTLQALGLRAVAIR